jgi:hypothetical protein
MRDDKGERGTHDGGGKGRADRPAHEGAEKAEQGGKPARSGSSNRRRRRRTHHNGNGGGDSQPTAQD